LWSAGSGCKSTVEAIYPNAEDDEENERWGYGEDDAQHERSVTAGDDVK
jgi:hypothetical protein